MAESKNEIYVEKEEVKTTIREALCTICKTFPREYTCMACEVGDLIDSIEDLPFLRYSDVQPVKHGRWIEHQPFDNWRKNCNVCIECSECHTWFGYDSYAKTNYCPNCGAHMKEGEQE